MLINKLQSIRLSDIKWAHISLTLVGLMWVLPFVFSRHELPITTFDQEWWCAMLGVMALSLLVNNDFWRQPKIPRIAQLPIVLIGIVMLQVLLGEITYFSQALLYILYLMFAALLMLLGARLRACLGVEKLSVVLAIFLLVGAELSALIGLLQHYEFHTPLDALISMQVSTGVYGNLAQPNHFSDYVALGLISLGLLFYQRKFSLHNAAILALPLLFVMSLSGSRSSWLYLLLMSGLAWWFSRRDVTLKPLFRYGLVLLIGFGVMHVIVQIPIMMTETVLETNTVERLIASNGEVAGSSIRFYLWHEAWQMLKEHPWLGVGVGQFAWHHFELLPIMRVSNISGYYNNAHNLFFQLAAETGIAGLLALLVSFWFWFNGIRRIVPSIVHWWAYSALGVLAIHSLLEYPFWYAYFLAVAAILLGAFDETYYRLSHPVLGRASMAIILLFGLLSLVRLNSDYQQLKDVSAIEWSSENAYQKIRDGLLAVRNGGSAISHYADVYFLAYSGVNEDQIKQKIALGSNVAHFAPVASTVYRQAFLLAQGGQLDQAKRLLEQAIWSYPNKKDAFQWLTNLAEKDPAHFSALLEFMVQKEQEHALAVHQY